MPSRILRATGLPSIFAGSNSQCCCASISGSASCCSGLCRMATYSRGLELAIGLTDCRRHNHLVPILANNVSRELGHLLQHGTGRSRRSGELSMLSQTNNSKPRRSTSPAILSVPQRASESRASAELPLPISAISRRAAAALYSAKHKGRNRIEFEN
jgi:GGDEF domain-containing protein